METIELKAPRLVRQIEQLAGESQRTAEEVVASALEAYVDTLEREAIAAESEAFWQMQPQLVRDYPGEYVAIYQRRLVDHDADVHQLEARVRDRLKTAPVLIAPVAQPRELRWRGGRMQGAPS